MIPNTSNRQTHYISVWRGYNLYVLNKKNYKLILSKIPTLHRL